ncbi:MAG: DUF4465 domain-containing protein, partial [Flavobacteriales bacterium]|nr:DUF4465 domain-containing protein [Flavobacteriales bacterium]
TFDSEALTFRNYFDTSFGGFWTGGFAYTNMVDTVDGSFFNLYGVKTGSGYSGSANYAVGQSGAKVLRNDALYPIVVANEVRVSIGTYGYNVVLNGNSNARKFGDTTGTACGCPQGSYPDYFKLDIGGWNNGTAINDTVEFFLADYRFTNDSLDYIIDDWQLVDLSSLGAFDSLWFSLSSTDNDPVFGINTPDFFFIDNLTVDIPFDVYDLNNEEDIFTIFPNPASEMLNVALNGEGEILTLTDLTGKVLKSINNIVSNQLSIDVSDLSPGMYFVMIDNDFKTSKKLIVE